MKRRIYRKPPVAEAICELTFAPSTPWDPTTATRIWEFVREEYDGVPASQPMMQISFGPSGPTQKLADAKTNFPNAAGSRKLSIGHQVVTIHFLREYPGWETFGPAVDRVCAATQKILPDAAVARIGIRFINKVEIPGSQVKLEDYFPFVRDAEGFPQTVYSFLERHEYAVEEPTTLLIRTFASIPTGKPGHIAALLDIDAIYQVVGSSFLQPGDVPKVIEKLRQVRTDAFEASISDKLREIFDAQ